MDWFKQLFPAALPKVGKKSTRIFLDYASATPMLPEVRKEMEKYFSEDFYNPNAIYAEGERMKREVEEYRTQIARIFGVAPEGVIFTSGGTEANTWAVQGVGLGRIVVEEGSHPSVTEAAKGIFGKEVKLVSSVVIDNKLGREIREERKKNSSAFPLLHIDASQGAQYYNCALDTLACDLLSVDSAKLYGPKGIGALIVRRGVKLNLPPLGTPPVPLIAGFAKALEVAVKDREVERERLIHLSGEFVKAIEASLPEVVITEVLPNTINISVPGILPEFLVLALDQAGVMVSAGPACDFHKPEPPETPVRISLGRFTTEDEVKKASEIFCLTVRNLLK